MLYLSNAPIIFYDQYKIQQLFAEFAKCTHKYTVQHTYLTV